MGQAVAFGEEAWAGHGEHRLMQARRQIRRLVDTFGARGSGRHGGVCPTYGCSEADWGQF